MRSKKGFTLIELLAILVILAVIALIATPMIMNTINDAKKSAAVDSGYAYINAIENSLAFTMLSNNGNIAAGSVSTVNASLVKSSAPTAVSITWDATGTVTAASMNINSFGMTLSSGKLVAN